MNELRPHQELLVPAARRIGRNAAQPGPRVDRVRARIRQHHDHIAGVAADFDVSRTSLTQT
jgi:hypothetical protein